MLHYIGWLAATAAAAKTKRRLQDAAQIFLNNYLQIFASIYIFHCVDTHYKFHSINTCYAPPIYPERKGKELRRDEMKNLR